MSRKPIRVAQRSEQIQYAVRDIVLVAREAQRQGRELLYLNIGDPGQFDFRTPPHIVEAICRAVRDNRTSYAPSEGIPEAIEAIRQDAEQRCGLRAIQDIFVGSGASECIEVALSALVNPGESVLVPWPGYPLYSAVLAKLGCREVPYALDESNRWQPNLDDVAAKIDESTRALVVINPNNPTGSVCDRATLEGLLELAVRHDLVVLSDEIYDRLLLGGGEHVAMASLSDEALVLTFNGLSKVYLGPGLRLGWCISNGPEPRLRPIIEAMHKFLRARLSASHPVQCAVATALGSGHEHVVELVNKLRRRRDLTVQALNAVDGISCVAPEAAFYAFPRLERESDDGDWVRELVRSTGVVVVHGGGFGQAEGTAHFRVVFLPPEEELRRAFDLIGQFNGGRALPTD